MTPETAGPAKGDFLLHAEELSHHFPDGTLAIDRVNFHVNRGEFLLLMGRNGSGKTVLIRHLNGLYKPTGGEVFLEGQPIRHNLRETRRRIGLVFQDADSQIVGQTVWRDIAFGPENLRLDREEIERRVEAALCLLSLEHLRDQRPHLLSGGEKRRLAIAGVFAMDPDIIILDEPFSNLDFEGVRQVLEGILALHRKGHTIILVTHDFEKSAAHAQRVVIMDQGKIAADGPPEEIAGILGDFGIRVPFGPDRSMESLTWLNQ
jgi:biotin transport system ATP-binding protein